MTEITKAEREEWKRLDDEDRSIWTMDWVLVASSNPKRSAALAVAARNALPRLLRALDAAEAERDEAKECAARGEYNNRVIALELDCSWGGTESLEHKCKDDDPYLRRQYEDSEESLANATAFLERATTRQCYLAKQAAEAENAALKAKLAALVKECDAVKASAVAGRRSGWVWVHVLDGFSAALAAAKEPQP